jgi:hypothetical protein
VRDTVEKSDDYLVHYTVHDLLQYAHEVCLPLVTGINRKGSEIYNHMRKNVGLSAN